MAREEGVGPGAATQTSGEIPQVASIVAPTGAQPLSASLAQALSAIVAQVDRATEADRAAQLAASETRLQEAAAARRAEAAQTIAEEDEEEDADAPDSAPSEPQVPAPEPCTEDRVMDEFEVASAELARRNAEAGESCDVDAIAQPRSAVGRGRRRSSLVARACRGASCRLS